MRIKKLAPKQSQWEIPVPANWIEMERRLALSNKPIIKYKDLLDMATTTDFKADLFVKYMRSCGLLLATQNEILGPEDDIVVNPQWLINAFKQVIDFNNTHGKEINEGKLFVSDTSEIWEKDEFKSEVPTLLRFMEHFGLIAKPLSEDKFYYIPSFLEKVDVNQISAWLNAEKRAFSKTLVLDFRVNGNQIPFPHFDKMMAEVISKQSRGLADDCKT